jgi:hypothetical protein
MVLLRGHLEPCEGGGHKRFVLVAAFGQNEGAKFIGKSLAGILPVGIALCEQRGRGQEEKAGDPDKA